MSLMNKDKSNFGITFRNMNTEFILINKLHIISNKKKKTGKEINLL